VNAKDEDGNAPIHLATAASNASIVEALLEVTFLRISYTMKLKL
jgi:hypothetical protein